MSAQLDKTDRRLLDAIQSDFPLEESPFLLLAQRLSISEPEVMDRLSLLKNSGIIRQISAIFDSASLGYQSVLLAFRLPEDRIEESARIISAHPGVSHNYQRDHAYSLWCTLTVPPESDLQTHAQTLANLARAERYLFLPAIRLYKIGVNFRMSEGLKDTPSVAPNKTYLPTPSGKKPPYTPLSHLDKEAICLLQKDLAITAEPFSRLAQESIFTAKELLQRARQYIHSGMMRRYAAILRHTRAGYGFNIMSVWPVPDTRAEEVGRILSEFPEISHCYQRPTAPDWPYSHFAMLHAKTECEAMDAIEHMKQSTGISDPCLLRSIREFKKFRVQYFSPDIPIWEALHLKK